MDGANARSHFKTNSGVNRCLCRQAVIRKFIAYCMPLAWAGKCGRNRLQNSTNAPVVSNRWASGDRFVTWGYGRGGLYLAYTIRDKGGEWLHREP